MMGPRTYQIEVLGTDIRFSCRDDEFILEAMKRERCGPVQCGCFGGGCGVCKMKVVSGEYAAVKKMSRAHLTEQEREAGMVLICCVQPRGNLTVARI